jgi:hypothetical protein
MRAREFIPEFQELVNNTVDVMNPVNPSKTVKTREPGLRKSPNGSPLWSPPLQQQLDTVKDSVAQSRVADAAEFDDRKESENQDDNQKTIRNSSKDSLPVINIINSLLS